jgi:hypothetical protein
VQAKIEQFRRLMGDLTGDYSSHGQGDPRFVGLAATGHPSLGRDEGETDGETLQSIATRFRAYKEEVGDAPKTIAAFDVTMRLQGALPGWKLRPKRPASQCRLRRSPPAELITHARSGIGMAQHRADGVAVRVSWAGSRSSMHYSEGFRDGW